MQEELKSLITRIVEGLENETLDKRIVKYIDYKTKYTILKPSVKVEVELTDGKVAQFDVSDYFEGVIR